MSIWLVLLSGMLRIMGEWWCYRTTGLVPRYHIGSEEMKWMTWSLATSPVYYEMCHEPATYLWRPNDMT
jgi:hypothetical protein